MSTKHIKKKVSEDSQYSTMKAAISEALKALAKEEVPIGAVIVNKDGHIIARAHNLTEHKHTQAAHAEMLAIEKAGKKIGDWRLEGCWLYVTLEPCAMCYNLAVLSRLDGIVYGAESPLFGYTRKTTFGDTGLKLRSDAHVQKTRQKPAHTELIELSERKNGLRENGAGITPGLHSNLPLVYNSGHLPAIIKGIEAEAAAALLKMFFKRQRKQ